VILLLSDPLLRVHVVEPGETPVGVGRDPSNGVQLLNRAVSRRHAELRYRDGQWWVMDLASMNGTSIGAAQLRCFRWYMIRSGDVLTLGHMPLTVDVRPSDVEHILSETDKTRYDGAVPR